LALPYSDSFDSDVIGREPTYLAQQQGAFETIACAGGRSGQCVGQAAPQTPIEWDSGANPYTLLGDLGWKDYTVSTDALFTSAGSVQVMGRVGEQQGFSVAGINAYYLQVSNSGAWSIVKNTDTGTLSTLASGTHASLGLNSWHTLAVSFQGSTITAKIDGATVGTASDTSYATGQVGLGVNGYQTDQFDNLSVTPIGTPAVGNAYEIVNQTSGKAMTVASTGLITQSTYASTTAQQWELTGGSNGWLTLTNVGSGQVLDVPNKSTTAGVQLEQWAANGGTNQQWQARPTGTGTYEIYGNNAGLVAAVSGGSTADGAAVVQAAATGGAGQVWTLTPVPVAGATYALFNHNSGQALDVNAGSTSDGALIIQWPYHNGSNEHWQFVSVGGGYYEIVSVNSGKALEQPSTTQGTQLDQRTYTGATDEQWQLQAVSGGYYTLVNRASGQLADVSGASQTQGAQVISWASNGGANQQWQLQFS
jgi:hypothetical protein